MTRADDKDAEIIFKALDAYDHIMGKHGKPGLKVSFSELYAYATDPSHKASSILQEALSSDLRIRRDLNRLLKKQAIVHMGHAVAASSGAIDQREADGFILSLKPSKANETQIYLIIESIDRDESPSLLFVQNEETPPYRLVIENFSDGKAQILLSVEDDIVKALRNHTSEVILR